MILIKYILIGILFFGLSCQKGKLDEQKPNKGVRKKIEKTYYFGFPRIKEVPNILPDPINEKITKYNLNGDIIEVEENPYGREKPAYSYYRLKTFYNKSNKEIGNCSYSFSGEKIGCDTTIYSNNKIITYNIPIAGRKIERTETHFINAKGLKSKTIFEDSLGIVNRIINFIYDENGKIIAELDSSDHSIRKRQFNYDTSGRNIKHQTFQDGRLEYKEINEYDEDGHTEKWWSFRMLFYNEQIKRYDINNNVISEVFTQYFTKDRQQIESVKKTFTEYNDMGWAIKKSNYNKRYKYNKNKEKLLSPTPYFENAYLEHFKYEFDEKSRSTKITTYDQWGEGDLLLVNLEIIEYFDY